MDGNVSVFAQMNLLNAEHPAEHICPLHLFSHLNLWVDKHFHYIQKKSFHVFFPFFSLNSHTMTTIKAEFKQY